ncbi:MAG: hypothetical protein ISS82_01805 [Nanoarchaeota archaeon]|nr:hypothetical protein [Nanoarchaeota archaeon]
METVCIPKDKLGQVISDVERLVSHFEELIEDQDQVAKQRLSDIKEGRVEGKTEKELDEYLRKRGVKVD